MGRAARVTYLKSACPFVSPDFTVYRDGAPFDACQAVNAQRVPALLDDKDIDYVVFGQAADKMYDRDGDVVAERDRMTRASSACGPRCARPGSSGSALVDNAQPTTDVMECITDDVETLSTCAFPNESETTSIELASASGVPVLDLRPWICPTTICPVMIGDVLVYRQGSHLTATYATSLAPMLGEALHRATGLDYQPVQRAEDSGAAPTPANPGAAVLGASPPTQRVHSVSGPFVP